MNKFFSIAIVALVFVSCENSGNRKPIEPVTSAPTTINVPSPLATDSNKPAVTTTNVQPSPTTGTITNSTGAVALNPAHGAPGHRCDIEVGAPLNSPAINTTIPATGNPKPVFAQPQPQPQFPQPLPANNNTNVRLNPAHGAPGHDCSIPVGQPLKS